MCQRLNLRKQRVYFILTLLKSDCGRKGQEPKLKKKQYSGKALLTETARKFPVSLFCNIFLLMHAFILHTPLFALCFKNIYIYFIQFLSMDSPPFLGSFFLVWLPFTVMIFIYEFSCFVKATPERGRNRVIETRCGASHYRQRASFFPPNGIA